MTRPRFALAALLLLFGGACGEGDQPKEIEPNAPLPTIVVELVRVREVERREVVVATGTIAAKQTSNIGPLVEGVIERILVRVGDKLKKGDPLFLTRKAVYERRVREVEAASKLAEAQLVQAHRTFKRIKELAQSQAASKSRLEDAETQVLIMEAQRDQAAAAYETAKQDLDDTTVRAPFDSVVTERFVDEGVYLTNRFSMGSQSAVVQLQEAHIVGAVVRAPEAALPKLRLGLAGKLFIEGTPEPIDSEILILNDKVDYQTRTVEFRLPIANPEYRIKAGQFVRAEIYTDPVTLKVVPRAAVRGQPGSYYVFLAQDGRAALVAVEAVELDADLMRLLSGVSAGDLVVDGAAEGIKDGMPLSIEARDVAG